MIKINDIYWLAGFLDGEGTFTLNRKCPRIKATSTDSDLIQMCRDRMMINKYIYRVEKRWSNYKDQYHFGVNGDLAISWMMTLYPLLCNRRKERIKEIIAVWKTARKKR